MSAGTRRRSAACPPCGMCGLVATVPEMRAQRASATVSTWNSADSASRLAFPCILNELSDVRTGARSPIWDSVGPHLPYNPTVPQGRDPRALRTEIVARYRAGERHVSIAEALGISIAFSSKVCRAAGLSRAAGERPRTATPSREALERRAAELESRERERVQREALRKRAVELYRSGASHAAIARELGIHTATSAKIARAAGLGRAFGTPPRGVRR